MRALKFVPRAAVEDHLQVGWMPFHPFRARSRGKAVWLHWQGEGSPHHPELAKLMAGHVPGSGEAS